jgi:hypothetical protein
MDLKDTFQSSSNTLVIFIIANLTYSVLQCLDFNVHEVMERIQALQTTFRPL